MAGKINTSPGRESRSGWDLDDVRADLDYQLAGAGLQAPQRELAASTPLAGCREDY